MGFEFTVITAIVIAALYLGRSILVPLAISVVLTFVLTPIIQRLCRLGLPNGLSVALTTVSAFIVLGCVVVMLSRQVVSFAQELPRYQYSLASKIERFRELSGPGSIMSKASETVDVLRKQMEDSPPVAAATAQSKMAPPQQALLVKVDQTSSPFDQLKLSLSLIADPATTIALVVVFVIMLLLYRKDVHERAIRMAGVDDLERTRRAMDDAGERLNRYFLSTTAVNSTFGLIIGLGLWWIGIPNAFLWAVLATLLRYIPLAGVPVAAILPTALALVIDPGWTMVFATLALFIVTEIVASQVAEPIIQGEATGLSPLALVLSTAFWTLLWGPAGLFLAVPLTVILAVAGRHVERFAFLEIILGAEPALAPTDRFYQRILSGEAEEAAEQAQEEVSSSSLPACYDGLAMGVLQRAITDIRRAPIDKDRLDEIRQTFSAFVSLMAEFAAHSIPGVPEAQTPFGRGEEAQRTEVICIAARPGLSAIMPSLLVQLLQEKGIQAATCSVQELGKVSRARTPLLCVCGLANDRQAAPLKFLVRRLRRDYSASMLVGVMWEAEAERATAILPDAGFDETFSSLAQASDKICAILGVAHSADKERETHEPICQTPTKPGEFAIA